MKHNIKICISLFMLCSMAAPLLASGNYAVTETEKSRSSLLDIMSGREKNYRITIHNMRQKKRKKVSQKSISISRKHRSYKVERNHRKIIYLTFDDGPVTGTANVLKVLREEGIDATMFFVGKHVTKSRAIYNRAVSMPNLLIANHTYSHANGKYARFYSNMIRVVTDVDRAQRLIGGAKYLRLAGRNVWRLPNITRNDYALSKTRRTIEKPKYEALVNRGYQIYGWDIEWNFNHATGRPSYGAELMASRIENRYNKRLLAKNGKMILLAHDYMFRGQSGIYKLRELIHILRSNGWEFATIDDYSSSTPSVFVKKKEKHRQRNPFNSRISDRIIQI